MLVKYIDILNYLETIANLILKWFWWKRVFGRNGQRRILYPKKILLSSNHLVLFLMNLFFSFMHSIKFTFLWLYLYLIFVLFVYFQHETANRPTKIYMERLG